MATNSNRTYSIKFKSEGLQALIKDLKQAGSTFDSVLADSQKSVDKLITGRQKQTIQEVQSSVRRAATTVSSSSPKVVAFRNENSIAPRLVAFNSPFKGEPTKAPPDPLAKLAARDRALVEVWRNEYRNFFSEFKEELKGELKQAVSPNNDGLNLAGRIISTPFNIIGDMIKFPFEATLLGVFSGFGEKLTADFSKGFKTRFEKGLGLELQSIGEDIGDIVGQSVYRSYEAATKAVRNMILSQSPDKMPQVGELIEDLKKIMLGTLIQGAVVPLKAHKRIQLTKKALPQVMNEAGQLMINQQPSALEVEQIQKQKSITLLVGGVNNDPLANNTEYANRLLKPLLGDSHVVGIKNFWSNSKIGPEFKEFVVSLIRNIFSNETLSKGAVDFLKNQGFEKNLNLEQFKGLSFKNQEQFIEQVINFFEEGKLPFGRLLESAYQGYNPDDIMVAAQALYYKQLFPTKPLNIIGTSGGGFNAAGAIEILNKLGYKDIKGAGITTPFTGLEFTGNPDDFYGSIGTKDPYYQMIYGSALKGLVEPPGFMQIAPGVGMGHLLASYVGTPEFQNFFQYFFRDRIKVPKGMNGDVMNYVSRRRQNPEDENLQRTLLKAFGAPVEGYTFSSKDLAGLTAEIKKKAARIKDKDIKAEAQVFVDFLDTLTEELQLIEVLGKEFKPYKSLEKAVEVYPELELFSEFNQPEPESSDDALRQAVKAQIEVQQVFINFKSKIKAEADNIKRTLQSMRGEKVEGYAFYSPEEYETRAGHLGGLIGHLEKDLLKGATPKQKAQAYKYLSYLKRLQAQILERGAGGAIDPQLEAEGQNLFGFTLEGTAPAPTKEQRRAKIPKSPKQLATEYSAYLQQLKAATVEGFGSTSDLPQAIRAIKYQLREYRKAIADGQLEIAKNLGENLLEIISALRQVASSTEINPQTLGTLSRYQNEIIKGDKGQGRAQIGLTQLAESNPNFQALLRQSQSIGSNVAKGVTIGVKQNLASITKAGEELGEAVIKGAEGKLEIKSPSGWGIEVGKFIVQGLKIGLTGIKAIFAKDMAADIQAGIEEAEKVASVAVKAVDMPQPEVVLPFQIQEVSSTQRTIDTEALNKKLLEAKLAGGQERVASPENLTERLVQLKQQAKPDLFNRLEQAQKQRLKEENGLTARLQNLSEQAAEEAVQNDKLLQQKRQREQQAHEEAKALTARLKEQKEAGEAARRRAYGPIGAVIIPSERRPKADTKNLSDRLEKLSKQAEAEAEALTNRLKELKEQAEAESLPTRLGELSKQAEVEAQALTNRLKELKEQAKAEENKNQIIIPIIPSKKTASATLSQPPTPSPKPQPQTQPSPPPKPQPSASIGAEIPLIQENQEKNKSRIQQLLSWIKGQFQKFGGQIQREFLDKIFDTDGVNSAVDDAFGEAFSLIDGFFESLEEQFPIIGRLKGVIASVGVSLLAAFGIFTSGDLIIRLGQQALETARKFEQLDRTIISASGSAEKGAANLRFIASEARRLSLDLEVAKSAYGKLLASAQGTALEGEAANQIFSAVGEAALNKGLNREGQERVFLAIQQIISKGKVSAEELRQQLGEALPGTLQTASRALGVTTQQIDKMLQSGELVATDFLPKFAAQLSAENAGGVAGAANSAQASLTRFNNATTEFQRSLGEGLKPAEKLGLNTLSTILEFLRDKTDELIKALVALVLVLAWQLIAKLIASKAALEVLSLAFSALKNAILSALPAIAAFLSRFLLMTAAIETWSNVYKLTQDSFKDIADYANESAKGLDNLARAYREAGKAAKELPAPPKPTEELNSKEGPELLGMRWNFDTMFRNPTNPIIKALTFSPLRSLILAPFGGGKVTQGEREYNDFIVNASDLMVGANRNIGESLNAKDIIAQVQELDQQLETIRSQRFDLLPGDRTGLAKSIEQEQVLLKEREKLLKITSTISTNFARDSENIKKTLEAIDRLPEGANTEAIRAQLESTLAALSQSQSAFEELISSVGRSISESDRRLRNLTEGISQFNDALNRMAALARARTISSGINKGLTRTQIDRQLQELSIWESGQSLSQLNKAIAQIQQDLKNPIHAQSIQNLGINPETVGSAQLERMLGEGRSAQEQSTLKTVQKLKQLQQEAANAEYQLAQAQQGLQEAQINYFLQLFNFWLQLKRQFEDLAVQTSDTLEEIRRQFVSTVQSIKQTQNQTAFTSLKAILTQPLVTQAERLINATNDAFEQYLSSLTQEIEQAFSRAALDLNLEQQFEQINNSITDANRQQRDRVRNSTRQGEDTTRQWWDIRRQSPFAPGKGGSTASPSGSTASPGGATTSPSGSTASPGGATTSPSGSTTSPSRATTTSGASSPLGIILGISGETVLNPYIPEEIIRQSEQNLSSDVGLLPASIQQADQATQQATQQQIEALEGQKIATEQLTNAQRALGEMEARLSAQQRQNNLIRYLQETGYAAESLSNQVADLEDKYSESTPLRQHVAALRSIEQEYLSLGRQTRNQLNTLIQQRDRFEELTKILREQGIPGLQAYQQQLLQSGNISGAESLQKIIDSVGVDASFLEKQLPKIQGLIDSYQQDLNSLSDVYQTAKDRQELLNIFNERSFEFEKTKTVNQLDNQLREAQAGLLGNTYGRKIEAAQLEKTKALTEASDRYEQQRLDLSKDIALNPNKYTKEQIQRLEAALKRWFDATIETIDRQYQVRIDFDQREYNLQRSRSVNDIQTQLLGSQSQFLQNRGDEFNANNLLQRQAEIQESDRYQQQLFELEKDAALNPTKYTPEELARLKADLLEINSFNLQNIDKQFKDLGETIASVSEGALEEFFTNIFTNTKSIGEAFRDMALTILRSIAQIAAKQTVLSILGRGGGAFAQLFGMAGGGSVPAFATGGMVAGPGTGTSDSILARLSNGEFVVRAAAVREVGTDFLGDLNAVDSKAKGTSLFKRLFEGLPGHAQGGPIAESGTERGGNPVRRLLENFAPIPAFAIGGSVQGPGTGTSDSILARLSNGEFVMRASAVRHWGEDFLADLNSMRAPRLPFANFDARTGNTGSRTPAPTVIMNVSTPDANSFRRSETQIGRDAGEMYRRSLTRNS